MIWTLGSVWQRLGVLSKAVEESGLGIPKKKLPLLSERGLLGRKVVGGE